MIYHTFDGVVQLFPEDLGDAVLLTVTDGSVVVQTFHRGKASFCEAEDHSDRVFIRGLLQCIAALRATDTADKACFVQDGDDLLQIFIGDLLALRHILQANRFSCIICSKIQHQSQRISSSCRNPHVIFTSNISVFFLFIVFCSFCYCAAVQPEIFLCIP